MAKSCRHTIVIHLFGTLLLSLCLTSDVVANESRAARSALTAPGAKNPGVESSRVRSSRTTPSRQSPKKTRRSIRRNLPRVHRPASPIALRPRILDPSRIHTIDGESFQYGSERFRVRGIEGIWRPEERIAKQRLDGLLHEGSVTILPKEIDLSGRIVAEVLVNNRNLSDLLTSLEGDPSH
jgi:hypothetical protein